MPVTDQLYYLVLGTYWLLVDDTKLMLIVSLILVEAVLMVLILWRISRQND